MGKPNGLAEKDCTLTGVDVETEKEAVYWAYILRCVDGSLYTGITTDLERRTAAHNSGQGAKYTRGRRPVKLVYSEECRNKSEALRRELEIKRMGREEKLKLLQEST